MPATRKQRTARGTSGRESSRAKGWRTSDEYELELRRERGREEISRIESLGDRRAPFGAYRVSSASAETYVVEIRSLDEPVNSCGCPDHQANGLGTCKHVEGVLQRLRNRRGAARALRAGNPRTELFFDRREGRPAVWWRVRRGRCNQAERIVEAACSEDGYLLGTPVRTLARILETLRTLAPAARAGVGVSRYLEDWQAGERDRAADRRARRSLERDLEAGKPALDLLRVPLYPYQQQGVMHLAFTRRAILADEMGLGKTIQAIAACELLARRGGVSRVLVVAPASLKGEWAEQIGAFTDRSVNLVNGPPRARRTHYRQPAFFHLVNYEQVRQDVEVLNELLAPEVVILDEAQRIKNWRTITARQIKRLRSRYAFVLTGTPLENRIDDVYSIAQFLDPALFGALFRFNREFYVLDDRGRPAGYRNLDVMHRRLQPVMLRRRKEEVEGELPGRSDSNHFVRLAPEQEELYEVHQAKVARLVAIARRRPLRKQEFERLQRALACMRMACDTPFILDRRTRVAPKLDELQKLLEELLAGTSSKAVVFSEWERMLILARERSARIVPDPAWHTGSTPQKKRREEIRRFKTDPNCRILFSTDSGGVGLNLQAADVVINLDLPWSPARLEQRIARVWRKHQRRHVRVFNLVSEGTIEQRMIGTLMHKQQLAESVIDGRDGAATVPLSSGRAALIERVEALTAIEQRPDPGLVQRQATPPAGNLEALLEQALGETFVELRRHDETGHGPAILVIAKATDSATREVVERCVHAAGETPQPQIEVVDAPTWRVIERLVQAGVLQIGVDGTPMAQDDEHLARQRERAARAAQALETAKRRQAMARLLAGGGFEPEAQAPIRDAFDRVVECLQVLSGADVDAKDSQIDRAGIVAGYELPEAFSACHESLTRGEASVDVQHCLTVGEHALAAAAKALDNARR